MQIRKFNEYFFEKEGNIYRIPPTFFSFISSLPLHLLFYLTISYLLRIIYGRYTQDIRNIYVGYTQDKRNIQLSSPKDHNDITKRFFCDYYIIVSRACVILNIEDKTLQASEKSQYTKKSNPQVASFAVRTRLELATPCVTGMYSNQLNYRTIVVCLLSSRKRVQRYCFFFN